MVLTIKICLTYNVNIMNNYQEIKISTKNPDSNQNILFLYDILSKSRFEKISDKLANYSNVYALNVFFDANYKLVLKKPNAKKWCEYIVQYIVDNKIDLSKTIVVAQYFTCSLVPLLNKMIGGKIKRVIYISPFSRLSPKKRKLMRSVIRRDVKGLTVLYNDINTLKNNVDWVQTSRLENIVSQANIRDLLITGVYFRTPHIIARSSKYQKKYPFFLGLFLSEKDQIVDFKKTEKLFNKRFKDRIKIYPFFNSKLCCFEEEEFKFVDCVANFIRIA